MTAAGNSVLLAARAAVPTGLGMLLAVFGLLPVGNAVGEVPAPHVTLMLVYYWSIHRPHLLPPIAVAAIGLFQDLLWGEPPGLNMLLLLAAQMILSNQQAILTGVSFGLGWIGFIAVTAVVSLVSWIVGSLYYGTLMAVQPLLLHAALTAVAYPFAGWVFGRIDRHLV